MVKLIVLVFFVLICVYLTDQTHFLSDDYINKINKFAGTWKAKRFFHPDTPIESIKRLLGAKSFPGPVESLIKRNDRLYVFDINVPKSFDARNQWRSCKTIRNIPNQGDCGSCWAISAAGAFADRLCIVTKGKFNQLISAQEILTCCRSCARTARSGGCDGGYPIKAWQFISTSGVVTGGNYNTTDGCQPYKVPPCFVNGKGKYQCPRKPTGSDLNCTNVCYGNKTIRYEYDHHIARDAYYVTGKNIQKELLAYGPIEAGFIVYGDFPSYSSGVYKKSFFTRRLGRHAAKLVGWGEEKGVPYWTLINTWGPDWGENGTFRIRRGTNECGIEDEMVAGLP